MQRKPKFTRLHEQECSVSKIVAENGALRHRDILYVTGKICLLLEDATLYEDNGKGVFIHPDNIQMRTDGAVQMVSRELPLSAMEPYLPPELDQPDPTDAGTKVYALGMLMLYMATGGETKAEAGTDAVHPALLSLISRCTAFDPKDRFHSIRELHESIRQEARIIKKALYVLLSAILFCFVALLLLFFWQRGTLRGSASGETVGYRPGYSDGFEQGFSDAPGIGMHGISLDAHDGNLPGNNAAKCGAIAVSGEESIYFLSEDNLYRMDPYTSGTQLLTSAVGATCLQYYGGQLYCCTEKSILRIDPKTAKEAVVCDSLAGQLYVNEDTFYLYDGAGTGYLYRINPTKGTLTQLNGAMAYRCLNIVGKSLYYISPDKGGSICRSDLDGGNEGLISSNTYESICVYDGRIYAATGESVIRMDLNGGNPETLLAHPASDLNVSSGGVFCILGRGKTLVWLSLDGQTRYTVVTTKTDSFNVAGQWIFYRNGADAGRLWRVRISGTDNAKVVP